MMEPLDTSKNFDELGGDSMSIAEWDGMWVSDWLAGPQVAAPPQSGDPMLDYAHWNPDAWDHVELPSGMDGASAWLLLEAAVEVDQALTLAPRHASHNQKDHAGKHGGGTAVKDRPARKRISASEARGNSRPVSEQEFDRIADDGERMLGDRMRNRAPAKGLDENWDSLKESTYAEVQKSWGGATINARTGKPLASDADEYALTIKQKGQKTVSVPENASRQEFDRAMDTARERYRSQLEYEGAHLGVFHDDDLKRIDIDPVVVVGSLKEVEAIGAATHAIGGAYHFKSGDGFWPPHVAGDGQRDKLVGRSTVHWQGPGEWLSYVNEVQG